MMAIEPITREEKFLAKAGGQNVETPTPITRKEMFLQEVAKKCGSGGGGIKTAIIKQAGYDNALEGIAPVTSAPEATYYTCENMTFEEAKQIMLNGEPLAVMIKIFNNFGIGCRYSTHVLLNQYNGCIGLVDGFENMDIWWGPKGISTDQFSVRDMEE